MRNILFICALGYTVALGIGSLIRPVEILEQPIRFMDKLMHFTAYFGLTLLWITSLLIVPAEKPLIFRLKTATHIDLWVLVGAVLYGIIIEILQGTMTAYRTPDLWDIVANTLGALLAFALVRLYINKTELGKTKF